MRDRERVGRAASAETFLYAASVMLLARRLAQS